MSDRRLLVAMTAACALGVALPAAVTVGGAFSSSEWYGLRSEGVEATRSDVLFRYVLDHWGRALSTSAKVTLVVVPLALLIGAPAAWAFRRRQFFGRRALEAVATLPLSLPGITLAVALIGTYGERPRFELLVAGHLAYTIPLVIKAVASGLDAIQPDVMDAARTLGAGPTAMLRWVILPLLAPALIIATLIVFSVSWGELNVSFLLATPLEQTYPAALYMAFTASSFPVASAATVLFLLPLLPLLVAIQALGGARFHRSTGA